jgi:choline dehydrogenase-like flavoprotein
MAQEQFDVIIIGSGAGGGTLAYHLAPSGKRILLLERGNFLPREKENWDVSEVFVKGRYTSKDTWYDKNPTRIWSPITRRQKTSIRFTVTEEPIRQNRPPAHLIPSRPFPMSPVFSSWPKTWPRPASIPFTPRPESC